MEGDVNEESDEVVVPEDAGDGVEDENAHEEAVMPHVLRDPG